jgi:tetratricopeptide (TPR) repeat protein
MARIDPKPSVVKALFALSGNQCAFPGCNNALITEKGLFIGQLCHIEAANEKGPRFNAEQSEDARRSFDNLLLLCYAHHTEVDEYPEEFTVECLKEIKKTHEDCFRENPLKISDDVLNKTMRSIESQLARLMQESRDTNEVAHDVQEKVNEILRRLPMQSPVEEDKIYFEQMLSTIKEIKKQGKHKTAIDLLLDFREKNWDKANDETKYKVLANIGITYLDLHQKEKAAEYLQEIKNVNFETADSLSTLCLGYAIDGKSAEFDACFEKAVKLGNENVNLWVAYIERHKKGKTVGQIINELPETIRDSVPMLFTIGLRLVDEGKKAEGISFLKKALEKQKESPEKISDTKAAIATHLFKDLADPFKFVHKAYSEEELKELDEARTLLTEAWDTVGDTELAKYKWYIILNRGVINKITGKLEPALADLQKAFEISHEYVAFKNLLFLYIQMDRLSSAEELLKHGEFAKPLTEEEQFELKTFKARLIFLQGNTKEGIQLMSSLLDEADEDHFIEIVTHIVAMSIEHRQPDLGIPISERIIEKYPNLHSGYLFCGYIWMLKNDREKAIEYFDKANELLPADAGYNDIHVLTSGYMDLREYEKAIPLFERIADKNILNDFSRGLIHAYFGLGDLQATFALADNLFKRYPDSIYLAETVSTIYEETKQYDKAIEILVKLLPSDELKLNDVLSYRVARLYSFKKDPENTQQWALQIKHPENFDLFEFFTLAWLFLESGDPDKALAIAFDARTKFFDESDAHFNYFNLVTKINKDEEFIFPDQVRIESAVQIKMQAGEEKTFLITKKNVRAENVLRPDDPFALQLLGKKKGDSISIDNGYGFEYSITIIVIMDIYTYAFRETMQLLETRFAGQHPIGVFHFNPEAPEEQMEQLLKNLTADKKDNDKELFQLYNQRRATIGMLALSNRRNQVMQLFALMSSSDVSILSFTRNEQPAVDHALISNIPIVLDLTSLITLFFVYRKQNLLSLVNNRLIVSQFTVNELHACHDELNQSSKDGLFTMGYEDGKLVGHTTPKETIEEHQKILKGIIHWCNDHAQVLVSGKQMDFKREDRKKYSKTLGDCYFDTMLLSEEHQAAAVSDDDNLKNYMRASKNPLPFSTYELASWLFQKEKMSIEWFNEFRIALINANYVFIPVNSEILWLCFDASGYRIRKPFTVAVKGLLIMVPQPCAQQLAEFIKKLYLSNILATTREQVLLYVFREVSTRVDYASSKQLLISAISKELSLVPQFRKDVLELLGAF